jgi:hypothetical protein
MSAFDEALAAAADDILEVAGNAVSYQKASGGAPIETTAYRTNEVRQSMDDAGFVHISISECDFTLPLAELGQVPKAGDTITETIGEVAHRFEVLPIDRRTSFTWFDPQHTQVTVHAKRIE